MGRYQLCIDGEFVPAASGETREVLNPATGEEIARAPEAGAEDVEAAVDAAQRAFYESWSDYDGHDRSGVLRDLADALEPHREELAELETSENGKVLPQAESDVNAAIGNFNFYAGAANKHHGDTIPKSKTFDVSVFEPYGVVGIIVPFNWPPMHFANFVAPALAAGNTVVLKTAPQTPLTGLRMAEILDEHLPDGVLNVVSGGTEAGATLSGHPDVGKLAFTGSSATGSKVMESAAPNITPAMLELGGKNPFVVFDDAKLDIPAMAFRLCKNSGQACAGPERLLIHESRHDEFIEEYVAELESFVELGDGLDSESTMGPLVSAEQRDRVTAAIERAQNEGAELVYAGDEPTDPRLQDGYFVAPHVFDGVTPDMDIFQEEVFGPVIAVTTFETEAEAIELANDVEYGLSAMVWTADQERAMRVSQAIEAGIIRVNTNGGNLLGTPFGGYKKSGIGKKLDFQETMREFTRKKSILFSLGE